MLYSFEAVIDFDETKELFREFLQSEKNVEPLLFLEQVDGYLLKKSAATRFEFAQRIIEKFIDEDSSTMEINISAEDRQRTLKRFEQCTDVNCPVDLFQILQIQVLLELKVDCFPRFIICDAFKSFIDKKRAKDEKFVKKLLKVRFLCQHSVVLVYIGCNLS